MPFEIPVKTIIKSYIDTRLTGCLLGLLIKNAFLSGGTMTLADFHLLLVHDHLSTFYFAF